VTSEAAPILDSGVLDELRAATGDDEEFIRDLVRTYVDEAPLNFDEMTAALGAGDPAAIVRPAHTLKSSSASIGAMRLSSISRGIEEAGRTGRLDGLAEEVAQASAAWTETLAALAEAGLTG
jgi:HPt (histidine-containing phosphotransfer) domain-containing protein